MIECLGFLNVRIQLGRARLVMRTNITDKTVGYERHKEEEDGKDVITLIYYRSFNKLLTLNEHPGEKERHLIRVPRQFFKMIEKRLNYPGYIPIMSSLSAVVRAMYATIEIITGIALAALIVLTIFLAPKLGIWDKEESYFMTRRVFLVACYSLKFSAHGIANLVRSCVEFLPFLGNFACYTYDKYGYKLEYEWTLNEEQSKQQIKC